MRHRGAPAPYSTEPQNARRAFGGRAPRAVRPVRPRLPPRSPYRPSGLSLCGIYREGLFLPEIGLWNLRHRLPAGSGLDCRIRLPRTQTALPASRTPSQSWDTCLAYTRRYPIPLASALPPLITQRKLTNRPPGWRQSRIGRSAEKYVFELPLTSCSTFLINFL